MKYKSLLRVHNSSVIDTGNKYIYICMLPDDVSLTSFQHFSNKIQRETYFNGQVIVHL
jgi:hypothetical protein